jgi:hypothetical protein
LVERFSKLLYPAPILTTLAGAISSIGFEVPRAAPTRLPSLNAR